MSSGLDDVIAAETVMSDVDGAAGRLVIRGATLDALAGQPFEAVAWRLLDGFVDGLPPAPVFAAALGAARVRVFTRLAHADPDLIALGPTGAMRALLARLPDGQDATAALDLLAAPAVATAAVVRLGRGLAPVAPEAGRSHAADMLAMLGGAAPAPVAAAALDTYLVTVSDHGLNASTFAARVVASTQAGLVSSALAGLSALVGPLHGGAPGPVLDMLDAVGTPENAEPWIEAALERGERLMGFGHRVYRVRDPRADALKGAVRSMAAAGAIAPARLRLAEAVERAALAALARRKPDRRLDTNVEFYTALLLEALGFPREAFTAVFATGRMAGWIAHAREQALTGRLIRPRSRYIGPSAG
jgi:citrate synthase